MLLVSMFSMGCEQQSEVMVSLVLVVSRLISLVDRLWVGEEVVVGVVVCVLGMLFMMEF